MGKFLNTVCSLSLFTILTGGLWNPENLAIQTRDEQTKRKTSDQSSLVV